MKRNSSPLLSNPALDVVSRKRPITPERNKMTSSSSLLRLSPSRPRKAASLSSPFRLKSLLCWLIVVTLSSSVFLVVRYHSITTSFAQYRHDDWPPSFASLRANTNNNNNIFGVYNNRRRTTQTSHERRKRPPTNTGSVKPAVYDVYKDSSLANHTSLHTTTNWKTLNDDDTTSFCGSHAQTAASTHGYMGTPLNQDSKVLITNILSPLGVSLALRLHLDCHVDKIIGLDHLLPNTRLFRMRKMDSYALLQRTIPTLPKLIVPEMGLPMQELVETHKLTHVVHVADSADSYLENVVNMQDLLMTTKERTSSSIHTTTRKLPHVTYITTKNATKHKSLSANAIQLVASSLVQVEGTRGGRGMIGLQLPHIYGEYNADSSISQLTMNYLNHETNVTTIGKKKNENEECFLFVEDAVNVVVAAMQVQPPTGNGFATFDIFSNQTLGMLQDQVKNIVLQQQRSKNKSSSTIGTKETTTTTSTSLDYWLGWKPTTSLRQGASTLVSTHLAHKYPYGNVQQTLPSVPTPPQRMQFPCASECARSSEQCTPTLLDDVVKVSKRISRGCKYLVYTVDLWENVADLPSSGEQSDDPQENSKWCRIAFLSSSSPLVHNLVLGTNKTTTTTTLSTTLSPSDTTKLDKANGHLQYKNWTLVFVNGEAATMSEAEYSLLKIAPRTFFSTSVARAMYVRPNVFPVPPFESLSGFFKTLDPHERAAGKRKEYRSGVNIFRWLPKAPKKARRVVFSSLEASFPNTIPPKSPIGVYVKARMDSEGIRPVPERLDPQVSFYTYAAHFVQVLPRRLEEEIRSTVWKEFPFTWCKTSMIVHDLREAESHKLRCEWYDEHVFWGNSHLEDLSLAYILAKRKIMGTTGVELDDDAGWFPLMNPVEKGDEYMMEPERLTNADDAELFLRILPRPRTKATA